MRPPSKTRMRSASTQRGQPVGDQDHRAVLPGGVDGPLHRPLADVVQRRRGLVEDQDRRVLQEHAGQRQALPLAAGQVLAALGHLGLVAARHGHDLVVQAGHLGGAADGLRGRQPLHAVGDVLARSCRRRRTATGRRSRSGRPMASRDSDSSGTPPTVTRPAARVGQAQQHLQPGRFAAARAAGDADRLAVADRAATRRRGRTLRLPPAVRYSTCRSVDLDQRPVAGQDRASAGVGAGRSGPPARAASRAGRRRADWPRAPRR